MSEVRWMKSVATGLLLLLATGSSSAIAQMDKAKQSVEDRAIHRHAVEALIWAMPLLNAQHTRKAYRDAGVNDGEVGYFAKLQDWKFQIATPNNTTPYIGAFLNVKDGPIVLEIPASTKDVGIFGTILDFWQRPLEDVGAKGYDKGKGAKYLILPNDYQSATPDGYVTLKSRTNNAWTILRPIIKDSSPENLKKAEAFVKTLMIYPLAKATNPPETKYVDTSGKLMNAIPSYDAKTFEALHQIVQEEVIEGRDLSFMGVLAAIGIQKGRPYKQDAKRKAILDNAGQEALRYMITKYHETVIPPFYKGKKWTSILPPGTTETAFSFEFDNHTDYLSRGMLYYAVTTSVKSYGAATMYLSVAKDKDGEWLDGGTNYIMNVPANVPAKDFWSVIAHNLMTAAWIKETPKLGVASSDKGLEAEKDGSTNIYFGPNAPKGMEGNWVPTKAGEKFFLLFRFYGPEAPALDRSWQLNDLEKVK